MSTPHQPDDDHARAALAPYETLADTLARTAREHGLYAHVCPELLQLLAQAQLDAQIPAPLYQAVAELLVWLHGLETHGPDSTRAGTD